MRVLLDNNLDVEFGLHLPGYEVETVRGRGWRSLSNGELLSTAQREYDVLVTADKNMPFQSNVKAYSICVIVLDVPDLRPETLALFAKSLLDALAGSTPGIVLWVSETAWRKQP